MRKLYLALLLLLCQMPVASAQLSSHASSEQAPAELREARLIESRAPERTRRLEGNQALYYVTERTTILYRDASFKEPYVELKLRDPVYLVDKEYSLAEVRTKDGVRGYLPSSHISNVWIRISKSERTAYVYEGGDLLKEIPADVGYNAFADKSRRGGGNRDLWRTPEGRFFVVGKNPRSQYYKAFVLNYPNAEHAERGLKANLITAAQYREIVEAEEQSARPPMNTPLGGMIEIHGNGTNARANWTQGCVALSDQMMDELWSIVDVGTPVLIEP